MSWNVNIIGHPENVAAALEAESANFSGQSKIEYDSAKEHLIGLVRENFVTPAAVEKGYILPVIHLQASGSGGCWNGEQANRSCSVKVDSLFAKLV